MIEETRERTITIVLSGPEDADEMDVDDGEADLIGWVCEECGYKETTEQRGDPNDQAEDDDEDDT